LQGANSSSSLGLGPFVTVASTGREFKEGASNSSVELKKHTGNQTDKSLDEVSKAIYDGHQRIESEVKDQGSSLRNFIIICSVSVVLATSLVVALIIALTK